MAAGGAPAGGADDPVWAGFPAERGDAEAGGGDGPGARGGARSGGVGAGVGVGRDGARSGGVGVDVGDGPDRAGGVGGGADPGGGGPAGAGASLGGVARASPQEEASTLGPVWAAAQRAAAASGPALIEAALLRLPAAQLVSVAKRDARGARDLEPVALGEPAFAPPPLPSLEEALTRRLVAWFNGRFFRREAVPECPRCRYVDRGSDASQRLLRTVPPSTADEVAGGAWCVELYLCDRCGSTIRFPRFRDAATLLDARRGRCLEFVTAFLPFCVAAGLRAREVIDLGGEWAWVEVWWPDMVRGGGDEGRGEEAVHGGGTEARGEEGERERGAEREGEGDDATAGERGGEGDDAAAGERERGGHRGEAPLAAPRTIDVQGETTIDAIGAIGANGANGANGGCEGDRGAAEAAGGAAASPSPPPASLDDRECLVPGPSPSRSPPLDLYVPLCEEWYDDAPLRPSCSRGRWVPVDPYGGLVGRVEGGPASRGRGRAVAVTVGSCIDVSARYAAIAAQDAAAATAAAALARAEGGGAQAGTGAAAALARAEGGGAEAGTGAAAALARAEGGGAQAGTGAAAALARAEGGGAQAGAGASPSRPPPFADPVALAAAEALSDVLPLAADADADALDPLISSLSSAMVAPRARSLRRARAPLPAPPPAQPSLRVTLRREGERLRAWLPDPELAELERRMERQEEAELAELRRQLAGPGGEADGWEEAGPGGAEGGRWAASATGSFRWGGGEGPRTASGRELGTVWEGGEMPRGGGFGSDAARDAAGASLFPPDAARDAAGASLFPPDAARDAAGASLFPPAPWAPQDVAGASLFPPAPWAPQDAAGALLFPPAPDAALGSCAASIRDLVPPPIPDGGLVGGSSSSSSSPGGRRGFSGRAGARHGASSASALSAPVLRSSLRGASDPLEPLGAGGGSAPEPEVSSIASEALARLLADRLPEASAGEEAGCCEDGEEEGAGVAGAATGERAEEAGSAVSEGRGAAGAAARTLPASSAASGPSPAPSASASGPSPASSPAASGPSPAPSASAAGPSPASSPAAPGPSPAPLRALPRSLVAPAPSPPVPTCTSWQWLSRASLADEPSPPPGLALRAHRLAGGACRASAGEARCAFDCSVGSKWRAFGGQRGAWIEQRLERARAPARLLAVSLASANDAPERDPVEVVVEVSRDGAWTRLGAADVVFRQRWQRLDVALAAPAPPSRCFRVRFPAVRRPQKADSLQLGQIIFWTDALTALPIPLDE